ncbi:MAG: hypothetical protein KKH75_01705 [Actinobacteria bacterium]|nr:hypothetical protein [Actinomycetota bacterium]
MARLTAVALASGALLLAVQLAGCSASAPAESGATSQVPLTSDPSTSASPSDSDPQIISTTGIGALRRGGSFSEAERQLGGSTADERCPRVLSQRTDFATWVIGTQDANAAGNAIDLLAIDSFGFDSDSRAAPRTSKGIGLGSTIEEIRAAYPFAIDIEPRHADAAIRYTDSAGSMIFALRDGRVQGITVLAADAHYPWEYCG